MGDSPGALTRSAGNAHRILFLVSSLQGGGAERVAVTLCNHWARQGVEVTLVPTFSGRGECVYPLDAGVDLVFLADRVPAGRRGQRLRRLLGLRALMREGGFSTVISFLTHVNVAALLAATGLQVPVVVSERTYPPYAQIGWSMKVLRRLLYPRARWVVVQTRAAQAWLSRYVPRARGTVVPNPVRLPLDATTPLVDPPDLLDDQTLLVLAAGRLSSEKGFDTLLNAFARVVARVPRARLTILGEGPLRAPLERRIEACGLSNQVVLPGRVGNLADWYARADVFVLSSLYEGFPNVLLEALCHGVPAVSFDCLAGPSDLIDDGVNGLLVPSGAGAAGLSEAVIELLADPARRRSMTASAERTRDTFAVEHIAAQWEALLDA